MTWTLLVHGGAGIITRETLAGEDEAAIRAALGAALDAGSAILAGGGASLDAVEAAVQVLEDDSHFNAGRGAALTIDGCAELDAAIMAGDRRAGAVAGVRRTRSPVALARAVMEQSPHVLLSGEGADAFGKFEGLPTVDPDWFVVPERRRHLKELLDRGADAFDVEMKYGTVGAVALDEAGHLAAATSTGGVTGKRWARIGDSPVPGAGTYADDRSCAVSCTGSGEFFLRAAAGHEVGARIRLSGESPQAALDAVLADVKALGGSGGMIVAGADGSMNWGHNTPGMYRGRASASGKRLVAIFGDEG